MAKYGTSLYGTFVYGQTARLTYSVEPISLLALSFSAIRVSWESPQGTFSKIRLVRNQDGYAETAEDGAIVWEEASSSPSILSIDDGIDNPSVTPLVPGRMVYYRMFLFTDAKIWVQAGDASTIVPFDNETHQKLVSFLPRVFTSVEKTPLGEVDLNSDLYNFIGGLTLSLEELLAYLNLLRPRSVNVDSPISLLPLEYSHLGLTPELALPIKNQKRLIREALYLYSRKGTMNGLETYIESLTGYAPRISVSENLLLTVQDSTFYNSTGNWVGANATLTASTAITPATGTYVKDNQYTCSVVTTAVAYMILGADDPVRKGVPLLPSTTYTLSCKLRSPASAGNVTLKTTFYNRHGAVVGTTVSASPVAADDTWKTASLTTTTPANTAYADIRIDFSAAGTYYIDQVCYQIGERVEYDEARMLTIVLDTPYENLVRNPSFETNTNFWTPSGSLTVTRDTDVTDQAYSGTKSAKLVATGSWTFTANPAEVDIGQYYTASLYAKTSANMVITLTASSDTGATVATQTETVNNAAWTRHDVTILIPAGSAATTLTLSLSGSTGTFYIDCVQVERSFKASEYFDGSLPEEYGVVWGETAHNSVSYRYPSRDQKIPRLEGTLDDWIPNNSWWRVSTERNQEKYEAEALLNEAAYYISARDTSASGQTITNLGAAGALLPTTVGSTSSADSNDPKYLDHNGINYIYCVGANAEGILVPDEAALDITGDIDLRWYGALDDWTPAGNGALIDKRTDSSSISYGMQIRTTGAIAFYWTPDGSTATTVLSTVATGITDGAAKWIRATFDVDNGAGGNDVKFYTSDDGITWTQLGSTVTTAGTTSIYSGTGPVRSGYSQLGSFHYAGKLYRVQIYNGIAGTKVLDVDTSVLNTGADTTFPALTGQTVTISRGTSGRKTVAVCSPLWLFGTDDYMFLDHRYMSNGTYLYLPGVASNYASTPDAAALDITGDIDLRCKVAMDDWTPSTATVLVAKWSTGTAKSYALGLTITTGTLSFSWTPDGTVVNTIASTVAPTVADGATLWVRATMDADNGASGNDVKFYTSTDGTNWTQLGDTVTTAGVATINNSTGELSIGAQLAGSNAFTRGKIFRAQVLDGINGTVAFDADFETSITSLNQASFTESSANAATVTINRSGSTYRSAGITAAGYLYPGATNTFSASAIDYTGFGDNDSLTLFAVMRKWATWSTFRGIFGKGRALANGYQLLSGSTDTNVSFSIYGLDGSTTAGSGITNGISNGPIHTLAGVVDRNADTVVLYADNAAGATTSTASVGSLNFPVSEFAIGRRPTSATVFAEMEGYAFALFRRALTASEVRLLNNYFKERFK